MADLFTDPLREGRTPGTGIYVRAKGTDGRWGSVDIADLTPASLHSWLRSRGGANRWAEAVVFILLGHDTAAMPEDEETPAPQSVTEWGVRAAFAGNPEHIKAHRTESVARNAAEDLRRHEIPATAVRRTVTAWEDPDA